MTDREALRILGVEDSDPDAPEPVDACPECGRQWVSLVGGTRRCGGKHVWHVEQGRRVPGVAGAGFRQAGQGKDSGAGTEAASWGSRETGKSIRLASALEGLAAGVQEDGVLLCRDDCRALLREMDRLRRAAGEGMGA